MTGSVGSQRMQAIVQKEYGKTADVLQIAEIEQPAIGADEVLVKVRAAGLDRGTWHLMAGMPYAARLAVGLRAPKNPVPGLDVAGVVVAVGSEITRFQPGDDVFGVSKGSFAEFAAARESKLARKPSNLSFEQAAAVPVSGMTALRGLSDVGHLQAGQKVLIVGASGGVGSYAVQIAKALGAEVTGVCSTKNLDLVRSLGADYVIDYTNEDYTKSDQRYDVIYDLVNNHSFAERRRVLKPGGICVLAGIGGSGMHEETLSRVVGVLTTSVRSKFADEKFVTFGVDFNNKDLSILRDLAESGKIIPAVTKIYPLTETAAAYKYLETGHVQGKIAITVE